MIFPLWRSEWGWKANGSWQSCGSASTLPCDDLHHFTGCSGCCHFHSLHVILTLWGACEGLSILWLNQVLSPVIQTGCYSSGSQAALAVIWDPWAVAPLGSGEGSKQSSSYHQGLVTKGRGWCYSWERGNFAELWLQHHLSLGGVSWGEIIKWCSGHLSSK